MTDPKETTWDKQIESSSKSFEELVESAKGILKTEEE